MKAAQVKFARFNHIFGRNVLIAQLYCGDKLLCDGTIGQIMNMAKKESIQITNAQEILELIVLNGGFAS